MPDALDGLNRSQEQAVTYPGGPLVVVAGAGTGKTRTLTRRFAWLVEQGVPGRRGPGAHVLVSRGRRDARAARVADRVALRGAPRRDLPRVLHAAAAGRGARGLRRPLPLAGHAGRPARPAARAHRRADPAPSRDPRQPGAAARELRVEDRPAQGRDGLGGRLPRLRRAARRRRRGRRRAGAGRPRARVRPPLRRPRPPPVRARRARLRRPDPAGVPPAARAPARA